MQNLMDAITKLFGGGGGPMELGQLGQQSANMGSPPIGLRGSAMGNLSSLFSGQEATGGLPLLLQKIFGEREAPQTQAAGNPQLDQMLQPPQQPPQQPQGGGMPPMMLQGGGMPPPLPRTKPDVPPQLAALLPQSGGINSLPGTMGGGNNDRF